MKPVMVRQFGLRDYEQTWREMQAFTDRRTPQTPSEIWLLEHFPVFTQGQAGKAEHVLGPGAIPVIHSDRGGQVTYHGPGQLVAYLLLDLKAVNKGIRGLVSCMEDTLIQLLAGHGIQAAARPDAPGVYVDGKKIAALGLRVQEQDGQLKITQVIDLSPAFHALLEPNDVVLAINGAPVRTEREFSAAVDRSPRTMTLTVRDNRTNRVTTVQAHLNP